MSGAGGLQTGMAVWGGYTNRLKIDSLHALAMERPRSRRAEARDGGSAAGPSSFRCAETRRLGKPSRSGSVSKLL